MNNMLNILKSDSKNKIKKYDDFIEAVKNSDTIKSIYLKIEHIRNMIINYLIKLNNIKKK